MPTATAPSPAATPRRGSAAASLRPSGWTANPVPSVMPATSALNATRQPGVVPVTRPGRTAIETVAAPNTHGATGATRPRKAGSPAEPTRNPRPEPPATVSGARHSGTSTASPTTRCGTYAVTSGAGAHWASSPATTGPSPNPAVRAIAARRAPDPGGTEGSAADSSSTQALPAANAAPLATPASSRPA